jgi:hypothetical protein
MSAMNWTMAKDILGAVGTVASLASLGYKCASSLLKKSKNEGLHVGLEHFQKNNPKAV